MTTIKVTGEDIANSDTRKCQYCPVALAIKRVVKTDVLVSAGYSILKIGDLSVYGVTLLKTPPIVRHFMLDFDHVHVVKPFEFELDIPSDYLRNTNEVSV